MLSEGKHMHCTFESKCDEHLDRQTLLNTVKLCENIVNAYQGS